MIAEESSESRIMVALVSDQRMQNIIPIFQKGAKYEELVLVFSKERGTGKPHSKYEKAANDLSAVLSPRVKIRFSEDFVEPYDIEAIAESITCLLNKYDSKQEVIVNISGGTKPMAIGALQAAHKLGRICLYTNTENEEILKLPPSGSIESEALQVSGLDVDTYIRAYGEQVIESKKVEDLDTKNCEWAKIIGDQHSIIYQKIIVPVTTTFKKAQNSKEKFPISCKIKSTRRQREVINQLAQMGLWLYREDTDEIILTDMVSASFLDGLWVEAYVGMQIQQSRYFDDVELNVKLNGWDGEIDVAAVSNGKLVLIECKSNVQQSQQLSKLDSFRGRLGGTFAKAYYARASEAHANTIKKQCRKHGLNGEFFGSELSEIGEKIGKNIKKVF